MDALGLVNLVATVLRALPRRDAGPRVVATGGYPYCGKTFVATLLTEVMGRSRSCVLPTESYIMPRATRLTLGDDGCSPAAHNVDALCRDVQRLSHGKQVLAAQYSWVAGSFIQGRARLTAATGGAAVIDGTVSIAGAVASLVDVPLFFRPLNPEVWLREAVDRDVAERSWIEGEALVQNLAKAKTCDMLLAMINSDVIIIDVEVARRRGCASFDYHLRTELAI